MSVLAVIVRLLANERSRQMLGNKRMKPNTTPDNLSRLTQPNENLLLCEASRSSDALTLKCLPPKQPRQAIPQICPPFL
jgi:hypothetical protein